MKELKTLFKEKLLKDVIPSPSKSIGQEREPRLPSHPYDDDPLRTPSRFPERRQQRLVVFSFIFNFNYVKGVEYMKIGSVMVVGTA